MKSKLLKVSVADYYLNFYDEVVGGGATGFVSRLTHKSIERDYGSETHYDRVLEIGAGSGQHFEFVRHGFSEYLETDIRVDALPSRDDSRVRSTVLDATNMKAIGDGEIDRLLATCVLIHLPDPEASLEEWKRVVSKEKSAITLYLPTEPGMLLRLARNLSTVRRARKMGVDHLNFHYREHRYHYLYLLMLIRDVFGDEFKVKIRRYPFNFLPWNFSLWAIVNITPR